MNIVILEAMKLNNEDLDETIKLLTRARELIVKAIDKLEEASTYSIVDILLSGPLSIVADIFEYSKFSDAKTYIEEAGDILKSVRRRLKEMDIRIPDINHMAIWAVLDIGFDSLIIDLMRHYKIKEAKEKLKESLEDIDRLIRRLNNI
jgi:hypothetical protein